jgi:hypothetical protein
MTDWTMLLGPAVTAAIVSAVISGVTARLSLRMQREKLEFDERLAHQKADAEIAMAKRRFELDQRLVSWKRRSKLSERTLIGAYDACAAIRDARIPVHGGGTRPKMENETDEVASLRNWYYGPIERLAKNDSMFATLRTLQPTFHAYFGTEATKSIREILRIRGEMMNAAVELIVNVDKLNKDWSHLQTLGLTSRERPDEIDKRLDDAIHTLEAVCQPVLALTEFGA